MRPVKLILPALLVACLLPAQSPIGLGPGTLSVGLLDRFDWYTATASGCSAGARGMCAGHLPLGDTIYFTGWFADAHLLPVTNGLPVVGTLNDFTSKTCSGNLMVIQLAEFSWSARNASRIYEVNCMSSYGTNGADTDAPTGWRGHCTNNDDGGQGCTWKSRAPFVRNGLLYLPVERQISSGTTSIHDATMIVSADGGKTWKNPYTVAHEGPASATGDAPKCGAAAGAAGNPCTDPSYPGSIMWPKMSLAASQWEVVQYGQDGAAPPAGVNDGCDPALYTCFLPGEQEASVARVLNTDLPSLDVTKWQYYTCPAITQSYRCPGSDPANWTSNFADRTQVARLMIPFGSRYIAWNGFFGVAYIKEFKSYLMTGYQNRGPGGLTATTFATAPSIQGPWTTILSKEHPPGSTTTIWPGFMSPSLALGYTVVSTDPPHVKLTTVSDDYVYTSQTTPFFGQWDLVPGRTPMLQGGENPRTNNVHGYTTNAGYIFSQSHATGTFPGKDLIWAFDFYDHGGDTTVNDVGGFRDVAGGSAFLVNCPNGAQCGYFNPGQGSILAPYGVQLGGEYQARLVTAMHETSQTAAIGAAKANTSGFTLLNAPAAMQGNGTFTVAGVFRYDAAGYGMVPLWTTGDSTGSNTSVGLRYSSNSGAGPELAWWGNAAGYWKYSSAFALVPGKWYFIAATVEANGDTPDAHLWIGVGGELVDKFAGVARTATGGNPVQTPNVAAAPLSLGTEPGQNVTTNASYASLFVYNRALEQGEAGLMYQTLKKKMAERGVTLQ